MKGLQPCQRMVKGTWYCEIFQFRSTAQTCWYCEIDCVVHRACWYNWNNCNE